MKVLFICTGNTCRSPMAEALLMHKRPDYQVKSAGIYATEDAPANPHAVKVLEDIGISHHNHTSQMVTNELLDWADLVLTMTTQHKELLAMQQSDQHEKYFTLKEYALSSKITGESLDISDPFGGSISIYGETLEEINEYIERIIEKHH